jgi:hypothetical protein
MSTQRFALLVPFIISNKSYLTTSVLQRHRIKSWYVYSLHGERANGQLLLQILRLAAILSNIQFHHPV